MVTMMMMMKERTLVGLRTMRRTQTQIDTCRTPPVIQVTLPMMVLVRADPETLNNQALQMIKNDRGTVYTLNSRLWKRPTI
jgi:hypothetical protein